MLLLIVGGVTNICFVWIVNNFATFTGIVL